MANPAEENPVDSIIDNIVKNSEQATEKATQIKTAVSQLGITTALLLSSLDEQGATTIAKSVAPGETDEQEATRTLVRGVIKAAIRDAGAQLELLHVRDTQLERARRLPAIDLSRICSEAQQARVSFRVLPNMLPPANIVKKVLDQPLAYYDLAEFLFPSHSFDNDLETITTITGEVVQRRRSEGKKEPLRNIGQWCQCFGRYATALQLSEAGREAIDFGTLYSYLSHVCAEFEEHPYQAVILAEAKYRRTGAMAIASGSITMQRLFGEETYLRPRLDMEIGTVLNSRDFTTFGRGKGFSKGKGRTSAWNGPVRGKGKGFAKGKGARSAPYNSAKGGSVSAAEPTNTSGQNHAELSPFYGLQAIVRKLHLHKAKVGDALVRSAKLLGWASSPDREAVVVADASLTGLGGVIFDTTSVAGADSRCSNLEWFTVVYRAPISDLWN
ncbi:hypothetical protein FOZ63_010658 [Perkinsus olseni]|uniref:Uncharacterized protein n=1 Tax=Perkinsus olseni TaxID=32597 RepID=A0A7J6S1A0_PEROL|nr:hypothetical protein FOZ62_012206 [Perkinsus olseni]KAF4726306.1 hypothetical protein FOZ63_010658 [Perkinsus olseni]